MPPKAQPSSGAKVSAGAAPPDATADSPESRATRDPGTAERLARRLDTPMGALGVVFLFVVLGQTLTEDPALAGALSGLAWALWAVFVAELALRAYVARDQRIFWRRNWWQVLFLALPFLRVLRAFRALRLARIGRVGGVLSSAVRGSRSAGRLLSGRIGWLAVVTGVVILASSQLLYLVGSFDDYATALHGAALSTVVGQPLAADDGFARAVEVLLAVYSVAVFATLAGAVGAYFLQRPAERGELTPEEGGGAPSGRPGSGTASRGPPVGPMALAEVLTPR